MLNVLVLLNPLTAKLASDHFKERDWTLEWCVCLLPQTLAPLVLCGRGAGGGSRSEMEGCGWGALLPSLCWRLKLNTSQSLAEMLCVYPNTALRTSSNVKDQESKQERKASYHENNQEEAPPMRIRQSKCLHPAELTTADWIFFDEIPVIFLLIFLSFSQSVKILYAKGVTSY